MGRDGSGSAGKPTRPSTLEVMPLVLEAIWPRFEPGGICLQGQARIFKRCSSHERRERRVAPKLARLVQATASREFIFQFTLACKSCGELILQGRPRPWTRVNDSSGRSIVLQDVPQKPKDKAPRHPHQWMGLHQSCRPSTSASIDS